MKRTSVLALVLLVLSAVASYAGVRTVIFMQKETVTGQDIFIKGGHDAGLVPTSYPSMSEPITYNNIKNATTAAIKAADASLDWGSESALDWTCNVWPSAWGTKKTYAVDGYGEDPENTWGLHWWKFDVAMDGASGEWFEFKAFMRQGTTEWWEANRVQAGTPFATINHWGKKGYLTRTAYDQNWVEFTALTANLAPTASFTAAPASGSISTSFTFNASASTDPEKAALEYRWDYNNDGTYDTGWSAVATASTVFTTVGTKTVKVEVRDPAGATASTTRTVTVNNTAPTASFALSATTGTLSTVFTANAASCADLEDATTTLQVRWDWDNDGTYDTAFSTTKTATKTYTTVGTKTIKLEVKDSQGLTATATMDVTVSASTATKTVHYKTTWTTANLHYNATGTWTTAPGVAMTAAANSWWVKTVDSATTLTFCFNNGSTWDSNNGSNYTTTAKEVWIKNGVLYTADPEENVNPVVAITSPTALSTVTGTKTLSATVSDNAGVVKVEFLLDGIKSIATLTPAGLLTMTATASWNSALAANGTHTLVVNAYDAAGNVGTDSVLINTSNPNLPPVAKAGGTIMASKGKPVTLDGSASYDPNGTITAFSWTSAEFGSASGAAPTVTFNNTGTYLVKLTVTDNEGASASDNLTVNVVTNAGVARDDFREETIYFVITTRFYDGDPANNVHCWDDAQAKNPDSDPAWRGDFEGLIQKLDYIKALGFSAVWITPVVKNSSGYDYHGYHAINHREVDPRYRTTTDASAEVSYQRLINAAHAKGIKIIQDIVVNHSGNFGEENVFPLFRRNAPTGLNENIATALTRIDNGKLPANYDSLLPGAQYSARIDAMKTDTIDTAFVYHHEKSLSWESYTVQTGQIAGDCVDLNTENPDVQTYLAEAYKKFIAMGVDSFRVDTVKHVSRLTFNNAFIPQWKAAGGDRFYIFGEVCSRYRDVWNSGIPAISSCFYTWKENKTYAWGTRQVNEASVAQNWADNSSTGGQPTSGNAYLNGNTFHAPDYSRHSGFNVIDFPMHWAFNNARDAFGLAVGTDGVYNDASWNVTYVDSHDYAPDGAPESQRFAGSQGTWAENLSLIFTFRGIPCIFYGSEIEFQKGKPIDVGPNAPLSTTGRAYFGDLITGSVAVTDFGKFTSASGAMATTLAHPLADHIRSLNLIRRAVPALQKGQYSTADQSGSGMAYRRRFVDAAKGIDSFALVVVSGDATFNNLPGGTYRDAVTGDVKTVAAGGSLSASAYGQGNVRVYVLNGPGKVANTGTYLK